jgi:hypothetical protein
LLLQTHQRRIRQRIFEKMAKQEEECSEELLGTLELRTVYPKMSALGQKLT